MPSKKMLQQNKRFQVAWERFMKDGEMERDFLRPIIQDSWIRSRRFSVDPYTDTVADEINGTQLDQRTHDFQDVLDIARPFMDTLYDTVGNDGMIVRLTDQDGYVLECFGDELVYESHRSLHLYRGTNVREEVIGTNAIGLALLNKQAVQVMGAEHYRKDYHGWTTSAAPICDEDGSVLAVLSMSGDYEMVHPHTLGMVLAASLAIEHELSLNRINQNLKRTNEHLGALMESINEGIMCVDETGTIRDINLFARRFLGLQNQEIIGRNIRSVLDNQRSERFLDVIRGGQRFEEEEVYFRRRNGRKQSVIVNATPIQEPNEQLKEVVFTFREAKSIHSLVNKITGAKAIYTFEDILGESAQVLEAKRLSMLVADTDATILLNGESGTGKELFAQSIHNASTRRSQPFVFINCGAIPRDLVASELFGYVEGAFTGARKGGQPGKFELADGGTLFLDEIGDMPLDTQANLLRVLETREVVRVGGHDVIPVDVRVIAATHKDLKEEVEKGNFRQDLFFRLNVMPIHTPALRERRSDIPALVDFFYKQFRKDHSPEGVRISDGFYQAMIDYDWPGNVRELQNVMQLVTNLVEPGSMLTVQHLQSYMRGKQKVETVSESQAPVKRLDIVEQEAIEHAIAHCQGNLTQVAKLLGIGRTTLYRKMEKYQIEG